MWVENAGADIQSLIADIAAAAAAAAVAVAVYRKRVDERRCQHDIIPSATVCSSLEYASSLQGWRWREVQQKC